MPKLTPFPLVLLFSLTGCAMEPDVEQGTTVEQVVSSFTITGKLEFDAGYHPEARAGEVPTGKTGLPYLYVCAWDREGSEVDWQFTDYPLTAPLGNDRLLGCARADASGNYSIAATYAATGLPDIYLSTRLCDDWDGGDFSAAEVCVRINAEEVSATEPANVKAIWSHVYPNQPRSGSIQLSWNLSCPERTGLGLASVTCTTAEEEPDDWASNCPCSGASWKACAVSSSGKHGDTNSRYGCNKEAVETYRAAIQTSKRWGSQKPTASTTFGKDCADAYDLANAYDYCAFGACQDEVNFHIGRATRIGTPTHAECDPAWDNKNGAAYFDDICIGTPDEPFRIAHELGHVIDMRWRCSGVGSSSHSATFDRKDTREGWADFVAVGAWFAPTVTTPVFAHAPGPGQDIEIGYSTEVTESDDGRELNVARLFWDLYDTLNTRETEAEGWSFASIRNIWSKFPPGTGKHEVDDSESDILDYLYWWNVERGPIAGRDLCTKIEPDYHIPADFLLPEEYPYTSACQLFHP